ncbi:uncharacterized protein LOC120000679 [Tripterygium wilfordii]|uniref:uncharacterized protein LOC120000679 n=1 Tax=Tripterygium wilfordii TaxID=458696 RepID=UPI0018F85034|nr:uncharacterized protein LOC120000679 [Tripterygium wilfordii]
MEIEFSKTWKFYTHIAYRRSYIEEDHPTRLHMLDFSKEKFMKTQNKTKDENVGENVDENVDEFFTDMVFNLRQSLIDWIQNTGCSLGYVIVIKRLGTSLIRKSPRLLFQCNRGGTYRSDDWMVRVVCGTHNQAPVTYMEGQSYPGRLSEFEIQLMVHLSTKNMKPRDILTSLKKQNSDNVSTIKTAYNAQSKFQTAEKAGSLERLLGFPHMLLMDATYKTNGYMMPLLEIVGSTMDGCTGSRVVVTDRELALMNASAQEMFVSAWIEKYLYFGNQTTNRVESQHAKLKRYLESSQSDLVISLSFIHQVIQSQVIGIKASIEQSKTIVQHRFNIPHFQELCGFVSIHALHLILKEFERSKYVIEVSYKCGCQLRTSYGLPCGHEQAIYLNDDHPIPIDSIDNFSRKLDLSLCVSLQDDDIDCDVDLQMNTRGRPSSKKKVASNTRANPSALVFIESDSPHSREPSRHSYSFGGPD